jgi:hypothetical protein
MKLIAVIEAQRPGVDHVILWDDSDRLIAYAYEHGHVTKTRPLSTLDVTGAVRETLDAFQINDAQLTRVHDRPDAITQHIAPIPTRWN